MKKTSIILLIGIISSTGFLIFSNSSASKLALRLGSSPWPGYETLFLARSLGYLDKSSVRLVELSSATEVIHALRNGRLEIALLTLDETLTLLSTGVDLTVVAVMDISSGADAILTNPKYKSLHDLKGKRIGVESSAVGAVVLNSALELAGMSSFDFTIVPLTINQHRESYVENKIDAVVTFEPVKSYLLSQGAVTLFDSSQVPGRIVDVLVVRSSILETHTDSICALVKAQLQALEYFKNHSKEATQLMAPRLQMLPEDLLISYQGITLPGLAENRILLGESDTSLHASAKELAELMLDLRLLKRTPNMSNLIDNRCVEGEGFE